MKEPETGKKEKTGKSGYSITTWRLHLWCRHPEWLRTTQEFYNRIAEFYYNLLLDHTDLWEMGSQQTLRELEIMSIPGRGGRIPSDPLPWQKVPLYFRRAAANEGIASAKSYISRFAQDEKIGRAEKLNAAVTYYKGMYQEFSAKAAGGRYWIRSQKFGEAPVYYIHFKGESVKVAPQVLDGRLGAIPFPTTINGFLHLVGSQLLVRFVHIR